MSFWRIFARNDQTANETRERRDQVLQVANSKEAHYRAMQQLAVEAGDEDAARFYRDKLNDLKALQEDLEFLNSGSG